MLNWIPWIDTEKVWHCFDDTWAVGLKTTQQQHFTPANHLERQAKRQYGGKGRKWARPKWGKGNYEAHKNSIDLIEAPVLRRLDLTSFEWWGCIWGQRRMWFLYYWEKLQGHKSLAKERLTRNTCREWEIDFRNPKLWILATLFKLFMNLTSTEICVGCESVQSFEYTE